MLFPSSGMVEVFNQKKTKTIEENIVAKLDMTSKQHNYQYQGAKAK